jgi:membrane-associated HD superfamily phosphohydrolase
MLPANSKFYQFLNILKKKSDRIKITPEFARNTEFQRWSVIILLNILLALLLTPDIHLSQPDYKIGSIATSDIKADRELLLEDRASTEQKRLEVIKDIQSVYDYDIEVPFQITANVAKAFTIVAPLYSQTAPAAPPGGTVQVTRQSHSRQIKKTFEDTLGGITSLPPSYPRKLSNSSQQFTIQN